MLLRYLGNKQELIIPLLTEAAKHCERGAHVVDIFSGSLAVSFGFKRAGYQVTANDINLFSHVIGQAYLVPTAMPDAGLATLVPRKRIGELRRAADADVATLTHVAGYEALQDSETRARFTDFVALQRYLMGLELDELPRQGRKTHFFDSYCEEGANSSFTSSRGSTGRRRFFSAGNALRLDIVLNRLREWHRADAIAPDVEALVLATLLRGAEKVANTQGTYHDFPRTAWDSRASGELSLDPPPLDLIVAGRDGHRVGREQDSLEFINEVPEHQLLYIDPPYNFRQYSAYYFLPNVMCRYTEMADPDAYFSQITYVRGQNPEDDFSSTFCKAKRFIDELRTLIARARCDTVMISYFTGKNHWNDFDSDPNDRGLEELRALLEEDLFESGSLQVRRVPRTNYASYGGYQARQVEELILVAQKRKNVAHGPTGGARRRLRSVA